MRLISKQDELPYLGYRAIIRCDLFKDVADTRLESVDCAHCLNSVVRTNNAFSFSMNATSATDNDNHYLCIFLFVLQSLALCARELLFQVVQDPLALVVNRAVLL